MKKAQFYEKIERDIIDLMEDETKSYSENRKELYAQRLGIKLKGSYEESVIWRETLFLSTNAILLLNYSPGNIHALNALKQCAEVYENLYKTVGDYDKDYCGILSALCYDIAGYQANASCIIREIENYQFINLEDNDSDEIYLDNYVLGNISKLLNKKLPYAFEEVKLDQESSIYGRRLFNDAMKDFYNAALYGKKVSFLSSIREVYNYFLEEGSTHISHLVFLLVYRLKMFSQRSIWQQLQSQVDIQSPIWQTYIRLLTTNPYSDKEIKNLEERTSVYEFWLSQKEAVESGYLSSNESFVVQMPTSAGKTLIAELAILNNLVKYPNKKCIYIAPYRALTNEKEQELARRLSVLGYSVTSLNGSYEMDNLQLVIMDEADVLLATPEKLDILFRVRPEFFNKVSFIAIDEGHMIGDYTERSALLEFLLIRLKMKLPDIKMLYISAVLSEQSISELSKWISGEEDNIINSPSFAGGDTWEPTRRLISKFNWEGEKGKLSYVNIPFQHSKDFIKYIITVNKAGKKRFPHKDKGKYKKSQTAALLAYDLSKGGNSLIFCSRPDWCMSVAKSLLQYLEYRKSTNQEIDHFYDINENNYSYKLALQWYGKDSTITKCLKRGIGVHHGIMFEPVKKAVENDYRMNKLRILVSTNTIGQGINFPIKNLILHSLVITHQKEKYRAITVRDFWNIIGRTGRAGIETEGEVVFLSDGEKDEEIFDKYIKKENLENIKSFFTLLIENLVSQRISSEDYEEKFQIASEPHLLHILAEELYESEGLDHLIDLISNNSLFTFQTNIENLSNLKREIKGVAQNIKNQISKEHITIFSQTGMGLNSNEVIWVYIEKNINELREIVVNDNYLDLLKFIYYFLRESNLREMTSSHTKKFESLSLESSYKFVEAWVEGIGLEELKQLWIESDEEYREESNRMELFIQECLYFRYPWGISSFITLLLYKLGILWNDLPSNIKSLSTFVRYGVNAENACIAMALGIGNRELAKKLSEYFPSQTIRRFMLELINSTQESLEENDFTPQEIEDILEIGLRFNLKSETGRIKFKDTFTFEVRGIRFEESRKSLSKEILKFQKLTYKREYNNVHDPFAIAIYDKHKQLGYVPRNIAKFISTDMDLNNSDYQIKVISSVPYEFSHTGWNRIKVLMKKLI